MDETPSAASNSRLLLDNMTMGGSDTTPEVDNAPRPLHSIPLKFVAASPQLYSLRTSPNNSRPDSSVKQSVFLPMPPIPADSSHQLPAIKSLDSFNPVPQPQLSTSTPSSLYRAQSPPIERAASPAWSGSSSYMLMPAYTATTPPRSMTPGTPPHTKPTRFNGPGSANSQYQPIPKGLTAAPTPLAEQLAAAASHVYQHIPPPIGTPPPILSITPVTNSSASSSASSQSAVSNVTPLPLLHHSATTESIPTRSEETAASKRMAFSRVTSTPDFRAATIEHQAQIARVTTAAISPSSSQYQSGSGSLSPDAAKHHRDRTISFSAAPAKLPQNNLAPKPTLVRTISSLFRNEKRTGLLLLRIQVPPETKYQYKTMKLDWSQTVHEAMSALLTDLHFHPIRPVGIYIPEHQIWLDEKQPLYKYKYLPDVDIHLRFKD